MVHAAMRVLVSATAIFAVLVGTCMAQDSATVVLGGTGPTPHLQTVIDGISDCAYRKLHSPVFNKCNIVTFRSPR